MNSLKYFLVAFAGALAALVLAPALHMTEAQAGAIPVAAAPAANAPAAATPKPIPVSSTLPAEVQGRALPSLAPIIKQAGPAVVGIAVRGTQQMPYNPFYDDPFFRRFFGAPPQQRERETQSLGSGVIVDAAKGYVVTNNHVVEDAKEITVALNDGRSLKAKLVGRDERTDLAVVQIPAKDLKAIPFADSEAIQVGDFVIAIGNPFGLDHTVTSGIISALGRRGLNEENYEDFIQTDAAINPGNSGGALIDLDGKLIGINTAIISRSGGNMGIGFAIPANMVREVMQQLIQDGAVKRGMLGVQIGDLDPQLAKELGVAQGAGAVVASVTPGSAAAKAGIQSGDVIVALDGKPVQNGSELRNRVGLMRAGQKVKVELVRDGKPVTLSATIAPMDETLAASGEAPHVKLEGAQFSEIDERSPFYGRLKGVLVVAVEPDSNAARRAGLQAGDIILGVNRRPVANLADFQKVMKGIGDDAVFALSIRRGNLNLFATVP